MIAKDLVNHQQKWIQCLPIQVLEEGILHYILLQIRVSLDLQQGIEIHLLVELPQDILEIYQQVSMDPLLVQDTVVTRNIQVGTLVGLGSSRCPYL